MLGCMKVSVVIATGNDNNFVFFHLVYQAVFTVNSAGPATGKLEPKWFWLAGSIKRSAASLFKKSKYSVG
jgi:hypothetical protein